MSDPVEELAEAIFALAPQGGLHRRKGVVQSTSADTATIRLGGSTTDIAGARCLTPVAPGDIVEVVVDGPAVLILGHLDGGWQALTLQNGWANAGIAGWASASYRKVGGVVFMRGLIASGTTASGTVITTLPVGHRPGAGQGLHLPAVSEDAFSYKRIEPDGDVTVGVGASAVWFDLTCSFIAEQ